MHRLVEVLFNWSTNSVNIGSQDCKAIVSVSEMARLVGLSRSRFYSLIRSGAMPYPVFQIHNRRPIYLEEQQRICFEVKSRNRGINGRAILFYARNKTGQSQCPKPQPLKNRSKPKTQSSPHVDLIEQLKQLGMDATTNQIESAMASCFPDGTDDIDDGEVLRVVFRHLKRQDTGDNVGR